MAGSCDTVRVSTTRDERTAILRISELGFWICESCKARGAILFQLATVLRHDTLTTRPSPSSTPVADEYHLPALDHALLHTPDGVFRTAQEPFAGRESLLAATSLLAVENEFNRHDDPAP